MKKSPDSQADHTASEVSAAVPISTDNNYFDLLQYVRTLSANISVESCGVTISLTGELTHHTGNIFRGVAAGALQITHEGPITLNLSKVIYIDNYGLGDLLLFKNQALPRSIRLVDAIAPVRETLQVALFTKVFEVSWLT